MVIGLTREITATACLCAACTHHRNMSTPTVRYTTGMEGKLRAMNSFGYWRLKVAIAVGEEEKRLCEPHTPVRSGSVRAVSRHLWEDQALSSFLLQYVELHRSVCKHEGLCSHHVEFYSKERNREKEETAPQHCIAECEYN